MDVDLLIALGLCFFCNGWLERLRGPREPNKFVAAGVWYSIGEKFRASAPSHCKGYGGQRFRVEMQDGRIIETDNLWHGGEIPSHLRDLFPDSAVFKAKTDGVTVGGAR